MKPFDLSELNLKSLFDKWDEVREEFKDCPKQSLGHQAYLCEQIIQNESNGKLKLLKDNPQGDFVDNNGLFYESKEVKNAFKRDITPEITVKNFRGKCLGKPGKTYDFMIVVDSERRQIAMFNNEYVREKMEVKSATITVKLEKARAIQTISPSKILL